jgi:hypothetical protein
MPEGIAFTFAQPAPGETCQKWINRGRESGLCGAPAVMTWCRSGGTPVAMCETCARKLSKYILDYLDLIGV